MEDIKISPSILAADFTRLGAELSLVKHADMIHLDVMDGHFVPNISFGRPIIEAVKRSTDVPLDIHLMIDQPEIHWKQFADLKPGWLTVHYETCHHLQRLLEQIQSMNIKSGIALNPHTPVSGLEYVLDYVDLILVMTVNPGYGGQRFLPEMLTKIQHTKELIGNRPIDIQVDGGISVENIGEVAKAGANVFVAGSAIFKSHEPTKYMSDMRVKATPTS